MKKPDFTTAVPLARTFTLKELSGRLGKKMYVPQERQGVRVLRDGQARLYPPGPHWVVTAFQRLRGLGAGLRAGYVPDGVMQWHLKVGHVISGDGQLLDVSILGEGKVSDAVRFLLSEVAPRKVIQGPAMDVDEETVFRAVYQMVQNYAAEDLLSGAVTGDLREQLRRILAVSLKGIGLELYGIDLITIWRAEDSLKIEEALFALGQKMDGLEIEKKMAEVENQAEFNAFMGEYVPDWPQTAGLPQVGDKQGMLAKTGDALRSWIKSETDGEQPGRNFRLKSLWKQKKSAAETPKIAHQRAKKMRWWPRAIWMATLVLIGLIISLVFNWLTQAASLDNKLEFYVVVWTVVIGALLESAVSLYKQWEEKQSTDWDLEGATLLDDLSRNNRQLVDSIVRQQCSEELAQQERMVNDVRSRVFKEGNEELALRLRRLEQKLAHSREQVLDARFGTAPYLRTELKISRQAWERMLDDDEHLLVQVAALTEDAHQFQARLSQQELDGGFADRFEAKLDVFQKDFASRQRALRAGDRDLEPYRMQQ